MPAVNRKFLRARPSLCTMCNRCAITCAFRRFGVADPGRSAIRIQHDLPRSFKVTIGFCLQCVEPACVAACPAGALSRHESGAVAVTEGKCDRCGGEYRCVQACPHGLMYRHPDVAQPIKCDLCAGEPLCVSQCPVDALSLWG